jgi:putative transposase
MAALKRVDTGLAVPEVCRELGISSATFYKWRANYVGMDTSMVAKMKGLEAENAGLKKMYIEERLKVEILNEAITKKVVSPSRRREVTQKTVQDKAIPIRLACAIFSVSEACYRYEAKSNAENEPIGNWPIRLTDNNRS